MSIQVQRSSAAINFDTTYGTTIGIANVNPVTNTKPTNKTKRSEKKSKTHKPEKSKRYIERPVSGFERLPPNTLVRHVRQDYLYGGISSDHNLDFLRDNIDVNVNYIRLALTEVRDDESEEESDEASNEDEVGCDVQTNEPLKRRITCDELYELMIVNYVADNCPELTDALAKQYCADVLAQQNARLMTDEIESNDTEVPIIESLVVIEVDDSE